MRKTTLLLAAVAGAAYVLGRRGTSATRTRKHYSLYQRAALIWTAPRVVRARRAVRHTVR